MLMPRSTLEDEEQEEDPRLELVRPLLEYAGFKEAAETLANSLQLNRDVYARDIPPEELWGHEGSEEIAEVGLFYAAMRRHLIYQRTFVMQLAHPLT